VRSSQRIVSVSALPLSVAAGAGRAQAQDEEIVDRGLGLRVSGGAYSSLAHLDDAENVDNTDSFTKGAGKFGVGVNYQIPRSRVALFVEGTTWVYKWQQYSYDKTQFDVSWNGGLSCTF
jgi:hypothetical protein